MMIMMMMTTDGENHNDIVLVNVNNHKKNLCQLCNCEFRLCLHCVIRPEKFSFINILNLFIIVFAEKLSNLI